MRLPILLSIFFLSSLNPVARACPVLSGTYEKSCVIDSTRDGIEKTDRPEYEKSRFPEGTLVTRKVQDLTVYDLGNYSLKADGQEETISLSDIDGHPIRAQATASCLGDRALRVVLKGNEYGLPYVQTETYSRKLDGDLSIDVHNATLVDGDSEVTEYSVTCKRTRP